MGRGARLRPALGVALSERFSQAHPFPLRGGGALMVFPCYRGGKQGAPQSVQARAGTPAGRRPPQL